MNQSRMNLKVTLFIAAPLLGLVVFLVTLFSRNDNPTFERRQREREELERLLTRNDSPKQVSVEEALGAFRSAYRESIHGVPQPMVQRARETVLKLGDASLSEIRKSIFSSAEPAQWRMELIGLVGDMKSREAEGLLLSVVADRTMDERLRNVALAKLVGTRSDAAFRMFCELYEEGFGGKPLILKAIGDSGHPESADVLMKAAGNEKDVSARIQAIDSLGSRPLAPTVLDFIKNIMFRESDENTRVAAIAALGKASDPAADQVLDEISKNPEMSASLRKAAANWLQRRAPK